MVSPTNPHPSSSPSYPVPQTVVIWQNHQVSTQADSDRFAELPAQIFKSASDLPPTNLLDHSITGQSPTEHLTSFFTTSPHITTHSSPFIFAPSPIPSAPPASMVYSPEIDPSQLQGVTAANQTKATEIFTARLPVIQQRHTLAKIQGAALVIFATATIGFEIAAMVTLAASNPIGIVLAVAFIVSLMSFIGISGSFPKHVISREEEQAFWKDISSKTLEQLSHQRWETNFIGSPYYGHVSGILPELAAEDQSYGYHSQKIGITYEALRENELMNDTSCGQLKDFLNKMYQLKTGLNNTLNQLDAAKKNATLESLKISIQEQQARLQARFKTDKATLETSFEKFRTNYIQTQHKRWCQAQQRPT